MNRFFALFGAEPHAADNHLLPYSGAARGAMVGFRSMAVRPGATTSGNDHSAPPNTRRGAASATQHRMHRQSVAQPSLRTQVLHTRQERTTITGRFADVCAELERLVRLEELHALRLR